jgi:hypothetical protein
VNYGFVEVMIKGPNDQVMGDISKLCERMVV